MVSSLKVYYFDHLLPVLCAENLASDSIRSSPDSALVLTTQEADEANNGPNNAPIIIESVPWLFGSEH